MKKIFGWVILSFLLILCLTPLVLLCGFWFTLIGLIVLILLILTAGFAWALILGE